MELDGHLDPEFCNEIIKRFESDNRKRQGLTGGGFEPHIKLSYDLYISRYKEWDDISSKLEKYINDGFEKYIEWLDVILPKVCNTVKTSKHTGFQIQKSGKYEYHDDSLTDVEGERVLTYIMYLNTPDNGGETDLIYKKVKPRTGKLLLFPATWTAVHGGILTETKYIVTGWFCRKMKVP